MNRTLFYVTPMVPALVIVGFFVWFANWIPQTRWEPPEKLRIEAGMAPAQLAALGKIIVRQRGCLACHTMEPGAGVKGAGRGPNLTRIAMRRAQGVSGGPDNLADYLVQALYEPGAYLVEGYANIMPVSTGAPAKLSYEEVVAVINYLQSLGGTPSVKVGDIPKPTSEAPAGAAGTRAGAPGEAATTDPVAMLTEHGCLACHSSKPKEVLVGPPFDATLLRQAAAERGVSPEAFVMEAIVKPRAVERADFPQGVMPQNYGQQLTAGQLQTMVNYLLAPEGK